MEPDINIDDFTSQEYQDRFLELDGKPELQEKLYEVHLGIECPIIYLKSRDSFDRIFELDEGERKFFQNKAITEALKDDKIDLNLLGIIRDSGLYMQSKSSGLRELGYINTADHHYRTGAVIFNLACAVAYEKFSAQFKTNDFSNFALKYSLSTARNQIHGMLGKSYIVPSVNEILENGYQAMNKT